jgi:hypothetical protein
MTTSDFAQRLVGVAVGEHKTFAGKQENDKDLKDRIYNTYLKDLDAADPNDALGWNMSSNIGSWAWSATFVSWCVLHAGATVQEFDFSIRHAVFVQKAIQNAKGKTGVFRAHRIEDYAPKVGDIIAGNRSGGKLSYDDAEDSDNYPSHTAIVVELKQEGNARYAVTIGGNESDSIRRKDVVLTPQGRVKQKTPEPYICVIETLKDKAAPQDESVKVKAMNASGAAPLSSAFRNHGTFVYDSVATIDGYGSVNNTVAAAQRAGMSHVWLRIHGRQPIANAQRQANVALIAGLKTAGLSVAGWGWCQGEDPKAEAAKAIKELDYFGLTDYVADIEPGHNNSVWTTTEVDAFCAAARPKVAGSFAISSFGLADWHEPHLFVPALKYIDALAPQIYWFNFPNNKMKQQFKRPDGSSYGLNSPSEYVDLCLDRWALLASGQPKPLILTGQAYWGEGQFDRKDAEAKLDEFLANWNGFKRVAGLNWWHFGGGTGMSYAMLEAIVAAQLGSKSYL